MMFSSIIRFLIDPFNILLFLLSALVISYITGHKRATKWTCSITLLWLMIITTPAVPSVLITSLEDRHLPVVVGELDDPNAEFHIVVLGSGHGFDDRLPPNSLLSQRAVVRLAEGLRLYNALPNSRLILSGYSSSGRTSQAEMLQQSAHLLGADPARTDVQTEPGNTDEEARIYCNRFRGEAVLIVVTSASHMERAATVFKRHCGEEPITSPTGYNLKGDWRTKRLGWPSNSNIDHMRSAMFEYAALARERFRS